MRLKSAQCIQAAFFKLVFFGIKGAHERHNQPAKDKAGHKQGEATVQVQEPAWGPQQTPEAGGRGGGGGQISHTWSGPGTKGKVWIRIPGIFTQIGERQPSHNSLNHRHLVSCKNMSCWYCITRPKLHPIAGAKLPTPHWRSWKESRKTTRNHRHSHLSLNAAIIKAHA